MVGQTIEHRCDACGHKWKLHVDVDVTSTADERRQADPRLENPLRHRTAFLIGRLRAFQKGTLKPRDVEGAVRAAMRHGLTEAEVQSLLEPYGLRWNAEAGTADASQFSERRAGKPDRRKPPRTDRRRPQD